MSEEEKIGWHFVHKTGADIERENLETAEKATEEQKSEYVFNGEPLYYLGVGHAFLYGFFNEYITKSGVKVWEYHSGRWTTNGDDYELVDNELILIPPTPPTPSESIDWSSIKFPRVKNLTGPIADQLISVKPKQK